MAGRNRASGRGPTVPAQEESQIWAETFNILKQLPDTHAKAQKIALEANKNQKILLALGNGEGWILKQNVIDETEASAELLGKLENIYQEGVRIAEQEARFNFIQKLFLTELAYLKKQRNN
jgi:hypothetical protein